LFGLFRLYETKVLEVQTKKNDNYQSLLLIINLREDELPTGLEVFDFKNMNFVLWLPLIKTCKSLEERINDGVKRKYN